VEKEALERKKESLEHFNNALQALNSGKLALLSTSPIASKSVEVKDLDRMINKLMKVMAEVNTWQVT